MHFDLFLLKINDYAFMNDDDDGVRSDEQKY